MVKENVLITGGAGFIGSRLANHHLQKGDSVWGVDNMHSGKKENVNWLKQNSHFFFDQADVREWGRLTEAVKWADRVYHMAAFVGNKLALKYPSETLSNNVRTTERLIRAICHSKKTRVLIASSSSVYYHTNAFSDGTFHEESSLDISLDRIYLETYPLSKLMSEAIGLVYAFENDIHCAVARIFNCVGVRQRSKYGMVIPTFVEQALSGKPLTIYDSGKQTRSFLDIRDAVEILDRLISSADAKGEIVNVGNDREVSILDLSKMVLEKTGKSTGVVHLSYEQAYGKRYKDFIDVARRKPYLGKMKRLTGYEPQYSLEQTLDDVIQFNLQK